VDAAEIVPCNVKGDSSFQILQLLAERIHEAGESSDVHTKVQIRALNKTGGNVCQIGIAGDWVWDRLDDLGRPVPVRRYYA
jgi:hypothetical protein